MAENTDRINKLRAAAEANPADPLTFFSLGRALLDASEHHEAVGALQRALALDAKLSKAYPLLAQAQLGLGRKDLAATTLRDGVIVANQRGDMMPKNEMIDLMRSLGLEVPDFGGGKPQEVGEGQVLDARTGIVGSRLKRPPFKNKLGQIIYDNVSAESFKEWIAQGTKVINELRLPLHDPKAQKVYDQYMIEFLNIKDLCEKEGVQV